jgi:serine protease Do
MSTPQQTVMFPFDTENYHFRFPGLPLTALKFFSVSNLKKSGKNRARSIQEFIATHQSDASGGRNLQRPAEVDAICQRLCRGRYLSFAGTDTTVFNLDGSSHCYIAPVIEEVWSSGLLAEIFARRLDCFVYGFPCIYDIYKPSVLPIVHKNRDDRASIGTGFVIGATTLLTAAHCIEDAAQLSIRGVSPAELAKAQFFKCANAALDLGIVQFARPVFKNLPILASTKPVLLQEVMALGYPDVPGFHPTLAAERALISSRLTASRGAIAATPVEIWAKAELLLITARVRGGFSGGPILDENGEYVGVISRDPTYQASDHLDEAFHKYDNLGYGIAIPAPIASAFLKDAREGAGTVAVPMHTSATAFQDFVE